MTKVLGEILQSEGFHRAETIHLNTREKPVTVGATSQFTHLWIKETAETKLEIVVIACDGSIWKATHSGDYTIWWPPEGGETPSKPEAPMEG